MQAWTHAAPHYSTLHKATRTRAQPQTQAPGIDNRRGHTESTRTTSTPAGLRGTPAGAPSRLVPHTLGAPAYHSQTTATPKKSARPVFKDDQNAASAIFWPVPPSANSHTEPLRATHRSDQSRHHPKTAKLQPPTRPAPSGDGQNAAPNSQASQPSSSLSRLRATLPVHDTGRRQTKHRRVRRRSASRLVPRTLGAHLPPGGPALHPRPRFARPRPPLGPPYRRRRPNSACHSGRPHFVR